MTDVHRRAVPPVLLRFMARVLIRGRDARFIRSELDASFARDLELGRGRARATWRFLWNVVGSAWSVSAAATRGSVTRGIGLDTRLGIRMLVKQPLMTLVAGLALGLGVPASLTLLHVMDAVFSELPVPDGDRLVGLRHFDRSVRDPVRSTLDDYERWRGLASMESVGAVRSYPVNVNAEDGASPVPAAEISASSFSLLRAQPLLGRVLVTDDERTGSPDVVVIGENLWTARFGRDPDILETTVRIGRTPHRVVGVMPSDFRFPFANQIWVPFRGRAADFPPGEGPGFFAYGRLADGAERVEALQELAALTDRRAIDNPERFQYLVGEVVDMPILLLNEDDGIWRHEGLVLIQTLIFVVLLVVCGNVGALIMARTAARAAEITIRNALGASRARILTQLFIETLVLAAAATGAGLLAANAFLAGWVQPLFTNYGVLPPWTDLTLTPGIVGMALGLAVLCAVVAGVLPALSLTRQAIQSNLQRTATRGSSVRFGLGSSLLIVSEIVLSVGFLAYGASTLRSVFIAQNADLGFEPDRYVMGTLTVPPLDPLDSPSEADSAAWVQSVRTTQAALLSRLKEDPAVVGVAMGMHMPGFQSPDRNVILETPPPDVEPPGWDIGSVGVDASFFTGLNRPILAGRDFNAGDVEGPADWRPDAVIVNESFVRHMLGGRSPLGQRLRYARQRSEPRWSTLDEGEWYEIVGVVGSFGTNPRAPARDAAIYHPVVPGKINPIQYAVEVSGDPAAFLRRFRQIAASMSHDATLEPELLSASIRTASRVSRATYTLVLVFAGAAFFLSATGLYALMSFTVSQRTREIGIRAALGARPVDLVRAVARRAAAQIGLGLALGIMWGWVLLNSDRNAVTIEIGNVPATLAVTAVIAAGICVLACARPTLRGLRIPPTEALREM